MLIDDTQPEETRVVVINGNKLEDVEFESSTHKQIKGNIYLGKIMRVEPSLQACFVDYGGNRHGFMAFGEIHPDYYNVSAEVLAEVDKEVDEIIENKKRIAREMDAEKERRAKERALAREARLQEMALQEEAKAQATEAAKLSTDDAKSLAQEAKDGAALETENEATEAKLANGNEENAPEKAAEELKISEEQFIAEEEAKEEEQGKKRTKKRLLKKRFRKQIAPSLQEETDETAKEKVLSEAAGIEDERIVDTQEASLEADAAQEETTDLESKPRRGRGRKPHRNEEAEEYDDFAGSELTAIDDDGIDDNMDFELQRKLIRARKLYHRHKIQDVIKEGQTVLVQVVKEERGNKGAAMTTYLSLAGRYCVLMPNRIKSGGVSRKITNAADRTRLKGIVKELPLTSDMSIIVRTAGEEKSKAEIVRDYNFLIRAWNQIRLDALQNKAPTLIHEEGNLIKRALRDIYTKDIAEIVVSGDEAYKLARSFFKILSPSNLKKIKRYNNDDVPLFQRFQVEGQLDKLHDANAQLESGGYLVINPTEALVSIDVNSGRATKEKDLEETALKTNLEACDEIARQLKLRNLAGLVVIDFIDMDEPANNHAVEKRMKEALKKDRSRIQVGKMSMFGLLELSRQRVHSAFWESNYQVCPYCHGRGVTRTHESAAVYILRVIEDEGCKGRSCRINVAVPTDVAVYLLNHKRRAVVDIENKYKMDVVIAADNNIKCVTDYRIERTKSPVREEKDKEVPSAAEIMNRQEAEVAAPIEETGNTDIMPENNDEAAESERGKRERRGRRGRFDRRMGNRRRKSFGEPREGAEEKRKETSEAVILYDSHENSSLKDAPVEAPKEEKKEKSNWWKKLIKG